MSVIILTKQKINDFETKKLISVFAERNITIRVCYFKNFDVVINSSISQIRCRY
jgi:hypothetical protein